MRLHATEKNLARAAGLLAGLAIVAALLWFNRPLGEVPRAGSVRGAGERVLVAPVAEQPAATDGQR